MVEKAGDRGDDIERQNSTSTIILVDQDSVIADFETGFLAHWQRKYPDYLYIPLEDRKLFYIAEDYPLELQDAVRAIHNSRGFIASLTPINGAIEALNTMQDQGFDVRICTSPLTRNRNSLTEKYDWVKKHLGQEWISRLIITSDKTLIRGQILIDDKPEITGSMEPEWEHIVFDAPYNRSITNRRRLSGWSEWQSILIPVPNAQSLPISS